MASALIDSPLRGEWVAINSPAGGDPGHGTDFFGQRHAIDFVQMDASATWYYAGGGPSLVRHLTTGLPASSFYCWGEPVHAAAAGRVVRVLDGWPDRARVQLVWELVRATLVPARGFTAHDLRPLAGNCVLIEGADAVALYGHLRNGTVRVTEGQEVSEGTLLGQVGNSGNSTMPHLHFHLMDDRDPLTARGIGFAFREYERWTGVDWTTVTAAIPRTAERVRFREPSVVRSG
jgi:hypothetical protein